MTGADLANLVNEAALSAARRNLESVTHECFEEALARIQLGALRPLIMSERERCIIAYHEGGHALVAYHLPEADTVNRVTILPRGQSLGVTQFTAEEDRYNYSRETLMARIAVGLGGRAAEELTFGSERVTTGAENDLQVVTDLARRMVTRWGMSKQLGVVFADARAEGDYALNMQRVDDAISAQAHSLAVDQNGDFVLNSRMSPRQHFAMSVASQPRASSFMMNAVIDAEVQQILSEGYNMARTILTERADQLVSLADALMEQEQLDRAQFETLLNEGSC
jgi:cell division protease FtsH